MPGRTFRALQSATHVWGDDSMTSFQQNRTYEEGEFREGTAAERKAFLDQAVAGGILEVVEPEEGGRRGGR
jgi:hypothetical protein